MHKSTHNTNLCVYFKHINKLLLSEGASQNISRGKFTSAYVAKVIQEYILPTHTKYKHNLNLFYHMQIQGN